jgi:hypothetical protein
MEENSIGREAAQRTLGIEEEEKKKKKKIWGANPLFPPSPARLASVQEMLL